MSKALEQSKTSKKLRHESEQRVTDAIKLRITDRVQVVCGLGFFAAEGAAVPCSASCYDCDAWLAAYRKTLQDFQTDMAFTRSPSSRESAGIS